MSVVWPVERNGFRVPRLAVRPGRWRLWTAPPRAVAYALAVDLAAVGAVAATAGLVPAGRADVINFAVLAAGCLIHLEAARGIERLREAPADGVPHINLTSMWIFAGLLVLPPPFVAALVCIGYLYAWLRGYGTPVVYRKVFSAATAVLASGCAGAVLVTFCQDGYPAVPTGPHGLAVLCAAALTWWLVNYALVLIVVAMTANRGAVHRGRASEQLVVGAALGLGVAIAALVRFDAWLLPAVMITVLSMHRGLLLHQFERAARTDAKTGLLNAGSWHELAGAQLARCRRHGGSLGVLMIDLDHFKLVNDRHGHLAGDRVLREVAATIEREVRPGDLVGRFGGEEFVVALPGAGAAELASVAGRVCSRIRHLSDPGGLTCSIGAARHPSDGAALDELLAAADDALFAAKAAGRDRVCLGYPATNS